MTNVVDADLSDAVRATTDERGSDVMRRSSPMKTAATAGSSNGALVQRPSRGSAAGQWWKAWVLLTSLGATVLGWAAFSTGEPSAESAVVAPDMTPGPTQVTRARHMSGPEPPRPLPPSAGILRPAMPHKPVFQAPVTRTRRS
jgi:hypothetical protein